MIFIFIAVFVAGWIANDFFTGTRTLVVDFFNWLGKRL